MVFLARDVGVDFIRWDAIHRIDDKGRGSAHILAEVNQVLDQLHRDGVLPHKPVMIAEADLGWMYHDGRHWLLKPLDEGGAGFDAVWVDGPRHDTVVQAWGLDETFRRIDDSDMPHDAKVKKKEEVLASMGQPRFLKDFSGDRGAVAARLVNPFPEHYGLGASCAVVPCLATHDHLGNTAQGFNFSQQRARTRLVAADDTLTDVDADRVVQALTRTFGDWTPERLAADLEGRADTPGRLRARIERDPDGQLTPATAGLLDGWIQHGRLADRQGRATQALYWSGGWTPLTFRDGMGERWAFFHGYPEELHRLTLEGRAGEFGLGLEGHGTPEARMPDPADPDALATYRARPLGADPGGEALTADLVTRRRGDPVLTDDKATRIAAPLDQAAPGYALRVGDGDDARIIVHNGGDETFKGWLPYGLGDGLDGSGWAVVLDTDALKYGGQGRPSRLEGWQLTIPPQTTVQFAPARLGLPNVSAGGHTGLAGDLAAPADAPSARPPMAPAERQSVDRAVALNGRVGANVEPGGKGTTFGVFWPNALAADGIPDRVVAELFAPGETGGRPGRTVVLHHAGGGFFTGAAPGNLHGWGYRFRRDGDPRPLLDYLGAEPVRPGEAGDEMLMRVVDRSRLDASRPLTRSPQTRERIAEVNLTTLTEDGTLWAARQKLAKLKELGFNAVEIMPPSLEAGDPNVVKLYDGPDGPREGFQARGWGYNVYGAATLNEGLAVMAAFVKEAHRHDIAVYVDVVWNHLVDGFPMNRIGQLDDGGTPWGPRPRLDQPEYLAGAVVQYVDRLIDLGVDGLRVDAAWGLGPRTRVVFEALSRVADQALREGRLERPLQLLVESPPDFFTGNADWLGGLPGVEVKVWGDDVHHELMMWLNGIDTSDPDAVRAALRDARLPDFYHLREIGDDTRARWPGTAASLADLLMHGVMRDVSDIGEVHAFGNHDTNGNNPLGEGMPATLGNTRLQSIGVSPEVTAMLLEVVPEGARTPDELLAALNRSRDGAIQRADALLESYGLAPALRAELFTALEEGFELLKARKGKYWETAGWERGESDPAWADAWHDALAGHEALRGTPLADLEFSPAQKIGQAGFAQRAADRLADLLADPKRLDAWVNQLQVAERLHVAGVGLLTAGWPTLGLYPHEMAIDAPRQPWTTSVTGNELNTAIGRAREHGTPVSAAKIPSDPATLDQMIDRRGLRPDIAELYRDLNEMSRRRDAVLGQPGAPRVAFPWGPEAVRPNGKRGDQDVVVLVTGEGADTQIAIMNAGDGPVRIPWDELADQIAARQARRGTSLGDPIALPDTTWAVALETGRDGAPAGVSGDVVEIGPHRTIMIEPVTGDPAAVGGAAEGHSAGSAPRSPPDLQATTPGTPSSDAPLGVRASEVSNGWHGRAYGPGPGPDPATTEAAETRLADLARGVDPAAGLPKRPGNCLSCAEAGIKRLLGRGDAVAVAISSEDILDLAGADDWRGLLMRRFGAVPTMARSMQDALDQMVRAGPGAVAALRVDWGDPPNLRPTPCSW